VWLTPQTVNKPQCLCVSDFVPTPDHDNVQSLVANVNDSIDRQQLKGTDLTSAFYASPARCCPLLQLYSCSVVCLFEMGMDKRQKRLNRTAELSMGPFCVTRPSPTQPMDNSAARSHLMFMV